MPVTVERTIWALALAAGDCAATSKPATSRAAAAASKGRRPRRLRYAYTEIPFAKYDFVNRLCRIRVDHVERGKSLSRGQRTVAGISAVLLLAGGVAGYQVGVRAKRPPHFARGGKFLATAPSSPSPGTGLAPSTVPATTALPTTVGARSLAAQPPTTARTTTMPPTSLPAPAGAAAPAPEPASGLPQLGTYTYQVTGTESATGFGSRDFPKTATVVAHRADGLPASQVVFDLTYSSDHTERAIAAYDGDGVSFVYEAGQVRFGPMAQT